MILALLLFAFAVSQAVQIWLCRRAWKLWRRAREDRLLAAKSRAQAKRYMDDAEDTLAVIREWTAR